MNVARLAVRVWPHHQLASRQTTNALRRAWIAKINQLGTRWLLHPANHIQRKEAV